MNTLCSIILGWCIVSVNLAAANAQEIFVPEEILAAVEVRMGNMENDRPMGPVPRGLEDLSAAQLVEITRQFVDASGPSGKLEVFYYASKACKNFDDVSIRQETVKLAIEHLLFSDRRAMGTRLLSSFSEADFDQVSKRMLSEGTHHSSSPDGNLFKLLGIAGMKEEIPYLEQFVVDEVKHHHFLNEDVIQAATYQSRCARLTLARLGESEHIEESLRRIERDTNHHTILRLLDDVAYIRQPEAIEFLVRVLNGKEERLKRDGNLATSAYKAARLLYKCLEDFPTPEKGGRSFFKGISRHVDINIDQAREWAKVQTEWNILR